MKRAITTITILGLMAAVMTLAPTTAAFADTFEDNNSVSVEVSVEATSREGNVFGYRRTTVRHSFSASAFIDTPSRAVALAYPEGCAANYAYYGQAYVVERRDDGAVRVTLTMYSWDGQCGYTGRPGYWGQQYRWIPAGETATLQVFLGSRGGSTRATATFTNNWAPRNFIAVYRPPVDAIPSQPKPDGDQNASPRFFVNLPKPPNPWDHLVPVPVFTKGMSF